MKIFDSISTSFNEYSSSIRNYLSTVFSDFGEKYSNNTVFGQIINVVMAAVQNIMLYIEDAFVEQNKFTAVRKKSIYGLAQLTGYNPSLGKSAGMHVRLSYKPTVNNAHPVIINNHTPLICNQNGLVYQIVLPQDAIVVSANSDGGNKFLYVVEGEFETQRFVSEGGKLYLQHVNFSGDIDEDFIEVKVNNELWERCSCLYDMEPDGKQWFYKTSIISGLILGFGNDVYGRSLKAGDQVEITYLKHAGEYGNIESAEVAKFAFVNDLTDISGDSVDGNNIFNLNLASKDNVTSGTFSESQEQVKQMIGYTSRSLVLAGPENYKAFINRFSFCGYNRTWSEQGSLVVNSLIMRNYKRMLKDGSDYFGLSEEDFRLTDAQKESITSCIVNSGRQLAGVTYNIYDPELAKYALYVYIRLKNTESDQANIRNAIRKLVGEFFANVSNDDYIPKSDIINLIKQNVPEVDGVNCYFMSERNERAILEQSYIDKIVRYNPAKGTYDTYEEYVAVDPGTNPNLGLDAHGNIVLDNPTTFPVLMGNWRYKSSSSMAGEQDSTVTIDDPLIITFE